MTGADEDGGITVAVVVSERLFKDAAAAADPSLIPNPKIGPRYLAMLDYFLGLPGNVSWPHPWSHLLVTNGSFCWQTWTISAASLRRRNLVQGCVWFLVTLPSD